ncbi:hypothetical protein Tco_0116510 [Tanacetum coccineum]
MQFKAEIGSIHMLSAFTKMNYGIEERHHGPSDALHNPSEPFRFRRQCYNLIPAESDSSPHAHTQRHTISIKIQESRKLKFKDKDFRNFDIQDLP